MGTQEIRSKHKLIYSGAPCGACTHCLPPGCGAEVVSSLPSSRGDSGDPSSSRAHLPDPHSGSKMAMLCFIVTNFSFGLFRGFPLCSQEQAPDGSGVAVGGTVERAQVLPRRSCQVPGLRSPRLKADPKCLPPFQDGRLSRTQAAGWGDLPSAALGWRRCLGMRSQDRCPGTLGFHLDPLHLARQ